LREELIRFRFNSIIFKFLIPLSIIFLTAIFIFLIAGHLYLKNRVVNQVEKTVEEKTERIKDTIKEKALRWESEIYLISISHEAGSMDEKQILSLLYKSNLKDYYVLFVAGLDGKARTSSGSEIDINDRYYFREVIDSKKNMFSEAIISKTTRKPGFLILSPVIDKTGKSIGLACGGIDLSKITDIINSEKVGNLGFSFILDKKGFFIAHPDKSYILKNNIFDLRNKNLDDLGRKMIKGQSGVEIINYYNTKKIVYYCPLKINNWSICVTADYNEMLRAANNIRIGLVVIIFIILSFIILTVLFLVNYVIFKPIINLQRATESIALNNLRQNVEVKTNDEIGLLSKTFNTMIEKLDMEAGNLINIEESLRESEQRWQYALEGSNQGVWDWNILTGECFFSSKWKELTGYENIDVSKSLSEWKGKVHKDDINAIMDCFKRLLDGTAPLFAKEFRLLCKNMTYKWFLGRGKIVKKDANGKPVEIIGTVSDITDRIRMNKILKEKIIALTLPLENIETIKFGDLFNIDDIQKIQDTFANATGIASIITDVEGNPITKPSNFCELCQRIINENDRELTYCLMSRNQDEYENLSDDKKSFCFCRDFLDGKAEIMIGNRHIANWLIGQVLEGKPDISKFEHYAEEIGIELPELEEYLGKITIMTKSRFELICDTLYQIANQLSTLALQNVQQSKAITEKIKNEKYTNNLNAELTEKNQELEQIIYVTSHDLRTPLVNIQGFAKELEKSVIEIEDIVLGNRSEKPDKEKLSLIVKEDVNLSLDFILKSIGKMDLLLSGLLTLSRLGRTPVNIRELDMNQLISNVLKDFEYLVKERNIEITVGNMFNSYGDDAMVSRVFSNLIENAIKFLDKERRGVIKISSYREDGNIIYCVEDNGIGIAAEYQSKIFELFYRLEPTKSKGEGIGLAITKKILFRLNGKIWLESKVGKGTTFYLSLPAENI
jgi:PAS domain S-box-containing protein